MSFNDIKGNSRAIGFLKRVVSSGSIAQAYIFLGPYGVGKKLAAINFAKGINCLTGSVEKPCDRCIACRKIDNLSHPDIFLLAPAKEGGSIKIEAIRELIKNIYLKPYEARRKVYIIDEAPSMTQEASNALLKILEEPPSESTLILITDKLSSVYDTLISRSQVVRFSSLTVPALAEILIKDYKMEALPARSLAYLVSGSLGEALNYNSQDFFNKREEVLRNLLNETFFDSDFDGVSREELKLYLGILLTWYRDIFIMKNVRDAEEGFELMNADKRKSLEMEAGKATAGGDEEVIEDIIRTGELLEDNINAKLAMGALGTKILKGDICTR